MTVSDIVVFCLFAVLVFVIVVLEVRSTQRMTAFIKAKKSPTRDDEAEEIVSMFLEWCRADPHRLKNELAYMQKSIEGVTLENHTH